MGNHYLPQHYLRGFADDGKLWAHDKQIPKSFETTVKSVANENAMYPDALEVHLANEIEGPAQGVIDRIRNRQLIDASDRELFARYVIAMWQRVPAARERVAGHVPALAEAVRLGVLKRAEELAAQFPDLMSDAQIRKQQVDEIIASYKANPPVEFWHDTLQSGLSAESLRSLVCMTWTFVVSTGEEFITCDDPVFLFKSRGIGVEHSELSMPLSSEICLWATREHQSRGLFAPAMRSVVLELNRRSAFNAKRFLFTRHESSWMLEFANKAQTLRHLE